MHLPTKPTIISLLLTLFAYSTATEQVFGKTLLTANPTDSGLSIYYSESLSDSQNSCVLQTYSFIADKKPITSAVSCEKMPTTPKPFTYIYFSDRANQTSGALCEFTSQSSTTDEPINTLDEDTPAFDLCYRDRDSHSTYLLRTDTGSTTLFLNDRLKTKFVFEAGSSFSLATDKENILLAILDKKNNITLHQINKKKRNQIQRIFKIDTIQSPKILFSMKILPTSQGIYLVYNYIRPEKKLTSDIKVSRIDQ